MEEMWNHFDCYSIFNAADRPIHSTTEWLDMREAYLTAVGGVDRSSIMVSTGHGFEVDVDIQQSEGKGRGVFAAAEDSGAAAIIPKGTLVWTTKYTARFTEGEDYRTFLKSIRQDLACDVIQWAYVQSLEFPELQKTKAFISADLDEGSFINSHEGDEEDGPNVGCEEEMAKDYEGGCKTNYFALRDIEAGEELLLDYNDFAIQDGWEWFGL